jgi:hypothetical protein
MNLVSFFHCLVRTKGSVGVWCLFEWFVMWYFFTVRSCYHLAQPPSWRSTPCQLSTTVYSVYSQPPSILEAIPPSAPWGLTMMWWQEPSYHDCTLLPVTKKSWKHSCKPFCESLFQLYHHMLNDVSSTTKVPSLQCWFQLKEQVKIS